MRSHQIYKSEIMELFRFHLSQPITYFSKHNEVRKRILPLEFFVSVEKAFKMVLFKKLLNLSAPSIWMTNGWHGWAQTLNFIVESFPKEERGWVTTTTFLLILWPYSNFLLPWSLLSDYICKVNCLLVRKIWWYSLWLYIIMFVDLPLYCLHILDWVMLTATVSV